MKYTLPPVPQSWQHIINRDIDPICKVLQSELKPIFPPENLVWNALQCTPFEHIKVVILGQDPYHTPNCAMGLAFSVPQGQRIPPSLKNIYQELYNDMGVAIAHHGDLTAWAKQGVLLLNTVLTVRQGHANSHKNIGWQSISTQIIKHINHYHKNIVFILWGGHAKSFRAYIDINKHCILTATHPSPLSANKGGFFGCKHFSKTNAYLEKHNISPIKWHAHTLKYIV